MRSRLNMNYWNLAICTIFETAVLTRFSGRGVFQGKIQITARLFDRTSDSELARCLPSSERCYSANTATWVPVGRVLILERRAGSSYPLVFSTGSEKPLNMQVPC